MAHPMNISESGKKEVAQLSTVWKVNMVASNITITKC